MDSTRSSLATSECPPLARCPFLPLRRSKSCIVLFRERMWPITCRSASLVTAFLADGASRAAMSKQIHALMTWHSPRDAVAGSIRTKRAAKARTNASFRNATRRAAVTARCDSLSWYSGRVATMSCGSCAVKSFLAPASRALVSASPGVAPFSTARADIETVTPGDAGNLFCARTSFDELAATPKEHPQRVT